MRESWFKLAVVTACAAGCAIGNDDPGEGLSYGVEGVCPYFPAANTVHGMGRIYGDEYVTKKLRFVEGWPQVWSAEQLISDPKRTTSKDSAFVFPDWKGPGESLIDCRELRLNAFELNARTVASRIRVALAPAVEASYDVLIEGGSKPGGADNPSTNDAWLDGIERVNAAYKLNVFVETDHVSPSDWESFDLEPKPIPETTQYYDFQWNLDDRGFLIRVDELDPGNRPGYRVVAYTLPDASD